MVHDPSSTDASSKRSRRTLGAPKATWSIVGSLVVHGVLVVGVGWIAYRSLAAKEAKEVEVPATPSSVLAIELPGVAEGTLVADRDVVPEGAVPVAFGGARIARVDTGSPGAGGDATGARATNLAAIDEQMRLERDPLSRLDRDQVQRLKTARYRTTHEDRRSTTHPMELTFLATGKGEHAERRPDAPIDPSRGSLVAAAPSVVGGRPGTNEEEDEPAPGGTPGALRAGQLLGSPGVGVRDGRPGEDHRKRARVMVARPAVAEGAPTIPGIWNGRPNDTVDSAQEVASAIQNLVHASVAGGLAGQGRGGTASLADDPGAGGGREGRGSVARPLGTGDGDVLDWNTNDPLLVPYFRKIHAKVNPLWAGAFPRSAMLELKQGTVILEFTIASDGTAKVAWPPVRPSGIDAFDRNCADAIRRASPFEPIPAALKEHGWTSLKIRAPFVARNPVVK